MNKVELNQTVKNLKELYTKQAELKEAISNYEADLKGYMEDNHITHLDCQQGSINYVDVCSKVLNMRAFRAEFENLYQLFTVEKTTKRFKVA